jgi:hypothetical protein
MVLGFSNGIPENIDETWKKGVEGRTYILAKIRKKTGHFLYYCQRSIEDGATKQDLSTGFETDRDLTRDEVERRQQFVDFMSMK